MRPARQCGRPGRRRQSCRARSSQRPCIHRAAARPRAPRPAPGSPPVRAETLLTRVLTLASHTPQPPCNKRPCGCSHNSRVVEAVSPQASCARCYRDHTHAAGHVNQALPETPSQEVRGHTQLSTTAHMHFAGMPPQCCTCAKGGFDLAPSSPPHPHALCGHTIARLRTRHV